MGKSMNPLPMTTKTWSQSQVTLCWLALVLLSGVIGCAGCQTKTQKVQQQKKALQIKDRKTPPQTRPQTLVKKPATTGVIKKKEKPKTKVATIVKPVIAKSIHHIQPGKPDENGVRRLFKFADLVQNEHFTKAKVYGKDRPTFVYLEGKKDVYTYWLSPDLKTAKKLPRSCRVVEENGLGVFCHAWKKNEVMRFINHTGKVTWKTRASVDPRYLLSVHFAEKAQVMIVRHTTPGGDESIYLETKNKPIDLASYSNKHKNSPKVYGVAKWVAYNPYLELLTYMKYTAKDLFLMKMTLGNLRIVSQQKIKNQYDIQLPNGRRYNTRQVDLTPKEKDKKKKVYLFQMTNANGQVLWEKKTKSYKMKFRQFVQNERFVLLYNQKSSHYYLHNTTTGKQVMEKPISFVGKNAGGIFLSTINGTISTVQLRQGKWQQIDYKIGYTSIQKAWSDTKNIYFSNTTYEVNSRYIYTEPISPLSRKTRNNNNAVFSISKRKVEKK